MVNTYIEWFFYLLKRKTFIDYILIEFVLITLRGRKEENWKCENLFSYFSVFIFFVFLLKLI